MKGIFMSRRTGIDIIIPVYNALEDVKLCLDGVKKHTDLTLDRVLLIDDKSPDEAVYPYLKSVEQPGMVVLQNEQNRGFSGTVNHGIEYSDRDVLLLNSDTIVTEGWIDKIVACAYSDPAIGTVTPFSNNATLCSIPNFCQENTVPYGMSIDEYARVIQRCSLKKYPRITVAVGFCMFIKREVIDRIGFFDEETFRKGYGEENDFCWRAEQLGYHHVLCDDTYIYHSGSASFVSEKKRALMEAHEQIVQSRYPKQNQKNAEYVRDNPHQFLRENVEIYAKLNNGRKNVLYLLHADFRADACNNVGGTQFHVKDLTSRLRRDHNVFVMARDNEILRLTVYLENEEIFFKFHIGKKPDFMPFHSEAITHVLREVLKAFRIELVHVHHILGLSFDIFHVAKEMGIPLVLSLHDYYYICPTLKLLEKGKFCGGCGENCRSCMNAQMGYAEQVDYMSAWGEACAEALRLCDVIITPSEAAKKVYAEVYPDQEHRIRVIPHGMDAFEMETDFSCEKADPKVKYYLESAFVDGYTISGWAYREDEDSRGSDVFVLVEDKDGRTGRYRALMLGRPDVAKANGSDNYLYSGFSVRIPDGYFASGTMKVRIMLRKDGAEYCSEEIAVEGYVKREKTCRRIAFLGGINETKGSQLAYKMMKQSGKQYDWYIIGGVGDPDLETYQRSNIFKTGWYKREDAGAILQQNQIDLVCILSIVPETFCYTVSEAELAGIPVLATDIGAQGERIRRDQTGLVISPEASALQALEAVNQILGDEAAYRKLCEKVAQFRHRSIAEMCDDYRALYESMEPALENFSPFDAQMIYNGYIMGQTGISGSGAATDVDLIRRVNELETTLSTIQLSLEYRMVRFLNRDNMPFKKLIKWMIRVAYKVYKLFSGRKR